MCAMPISKGCSRTLPIVGELSRIVSANTGQPDFGEMVVETVVIPTSQRLDVREPVIAVNVATAWLAKKPTHDSHDATGIRAKLSR